MPPEERAAARDGIKPYVADCQAQKPRPRQLRDLKSYLRGKVWRDVQVAKPVGAVCTPGSPQAMRWDAYWEAEGTHAFERSQLRAGRPISVPSEWPSGTFNAGREAA